MKWRTELFILLMLICLFGITLPVYAAASGDKTSREEIRQEAAELVRSLKNYSVEQRDEAITATESALKKLDRRIDALEAEINNRWEKMDKAAREKAQASLKALRTQRIQVAEWYGSLKNSAGGSWEHIKEGFSEAYKALNNAWEKSEKEFGANRRSPESTKN